MHLMLGSCHSTALLLLLVLVLVLLLLLLLLWLLLLLRGMLVDWGQVCPVCLVPRGHS
jgi:hypothetical protein